MFIGERVIVSENCPRSSEATDITSHDLRFVAEDASDVPNGPFTKMRYSATSSRKDLAMRIGQKTSHQLMSL